MFTADRVVFVLVLLCAGCGRNASSMSDSDVEAAVADVAVSVRSGGLSSSSPMSTTTGESHKTAAPMVTQSSILSWETVDGLPQPLAIFDHVFWEPDDTSSFRKILRDQNSVQRKTVLEIGTGSGEFVFRGTELVERFDTDLQFCLFMDLHPAHDVLDATANRLPVRVFASKSLSGGESRR